MNLAIRLKKAWAVLHGGAEAALGTETPDVLRAALLEKERQIVALQAEYKRLSENAAADAAAGARASLQDALKRVAPPMSQLSAMRAAAQAGTTVPVADVLKLAKAVEAALERAGLAVIGVVGEKAAFCGRLHQRMSGGDVRDGDPVKIEFVGYAHGDEVLLRAMVTRGKAQ